MEDELENFIRKNRSDFDDREVPESAWKNIERGVFPTRASLWNSLTLWRAAAVIFMAATGYLLVPSQREDNTPASDLRAQSDPSSAEFRDVEDFYFRQISEKVQLIDKFKAADGLNGFTQDFHQLEAMYSVLKEEMKNSPSEKVKDALVLNLLVRIDLLNQELHKLEKQRAVEKKKQNSTKA
jgi:hypothetical protein